MQFRTVAIFFAGLLASAIASPVADVADGAQMADASEMADAADMAEAQRDQCKFDGRYFCTWDWKAIKQCGYTNQGLQWRIIGECPPTTHCGYINNIPYCLENKWW